MGRYRSRSRADYEQRWCDREKVAPRRGSPPSSLPGREVEDAAVSTVTTLPDWQPRIVAPLVANGCDEVRAHRIAVDVDPRKRISADGCYLRYAALNIAVAGDVSHA